MVHQAVRISVPQRPAVRVIQTAPIRVGRRTTTPAADAAALSEFLIREAAAKGRLAVLERRAEDRSGCSVDAADESGRTALHFAAVNGHLEIVKALVGRYRAQLDPVDCNMNTPLRLAVMSNRLAVVSYLVEQGADVMARDRSGRTILDASLGNLRRLMQSLAPPAEPDAMLDSGSPSSSAATVAAAPPEDARIRKLSQVHNLLLLYVSRYGGWGRPTGDWASVASSSSGQMPTSSGQMLSVDAMQATIADLERMCISNSGGGSSDPAS